MFGRPATTLLLLTEREVVRADFAGGKTPSLVGCWRQSQVVEGNLANAAEFALGLGGKVGRNVYVLTTVSWTQVISIHSRSLDGLSQEDLNQTLRFEVESFSGLNAFDVTLGYVDLGVSGENREFWVTELPALEVSAIQELVAARGGKLRGIGHPSGLPTSLDESASWQRLEYWSDCVVFIGSPAGRQQVFVANSDPRSDRWEINYNNWRQMKGAELADVPVRNLIGADVAVPAEYMKDGAPWDLANQQPLELWLTSWAQCLADRSDTTPLIAPAAKQVSPRAQAQRATATAVTVLAACIAHWCYVGYSTQWMKSRVSGLQTPVKQLQKLERDLGKLKKQRQGLVEQQQEVSLSAAKAAVVLGEYRGRIADLLAALAHSATENIVISKLTSNDKGIQISGTSLVTDGATNLASALQPLLLPLGWEVAPPTQTGTDQLESGGPWRFRIKLVDSLPQPRASADRVVVK